jgi:hypothetical protein
VQAQAGKVLACASGALMSRQCLVVFVLLFTPTATLPQRYGRPYSLAENQVYLQIKAQNKSRYFSPYDLQKKQRSVVTLEDPSTNTSHTYEGVALEQLVPSPLDGETIQIEFGSHEIMTVDGTDLDPTTKLIVIDTVDGKLLGGHVPFCLVEKRRGRNPEKITDVRSITVK